MKKTRTCDNKSLGKKNRRDTLMVICAAAVLAGLAVVLVMWLNPGYSREPYQRQEIDVLDDVVTITAYGKNQSRVEGAVDAAFQEFYRVDEMADRYDPQSEIARVNAAAAVGPVVVSDELWDMISESMEMYEASGGLFDITVGPLVDVWDVVGRGGLIEGPPVWDWLGGLSRRKGPPSPDEIDAAMELVGADKLVLDGAAHSVFLTREGMILDPGGIAKGYALDRAEEALRSGGVEAGIIDLISTSVVIGDKPEAAGGPLWIFAIQDPRSAGHLAEFTLSGNTYFSTSGDNQRFFEYEGVRYHHILDPRTGYPAGGTMAVTVVGGPSGAWSDAMSTATFIMGYPEGMTWAEAVEGVQVVMVDPDGVVHTTPSLDPSLLFIKEKAGAGSG